jgi:hypothetical protein
LRGLDWVGRTRMDWVVLWQGRQRIGLGWVYLVRLDWSNWIRRDMTESVKIMHVRVD